MFRSLVVFVLASSLMVLCQTPAGVTVNGGYVAPVMPGPPLLAPPNAALPGSGPATGAPPAIGVNDSRYGGSGNVYYPSAGTLMGTESGTTPGPAAAGVTVGSLPASGGTTANGATNGTQP